MDSVLNGIFNPDEPGGSILVMKGDSVAYLRNFGIADLTTGEKITENTVFNTGSISKTFVSNAILMLHERNQLSIDDKISKYFPDFDNGELADKVTIKNLLAHNSGLPDIRRELNDLNYYLTAKDTGNFEPIKRATELNFEPGEQFQYSNPAYNGLALIINQVTGEKWQKFVYENILKPSGMPNSKITDGSFPDTGVAHAYEFKEGAFQELDYGEEPFFVAAGNGGIWSSVVELASYEKAIRNHQFLSEELLQESRTVFQPENWKGEAGAFIGYSWFIEDKGLYKGDLAGTSMVSHTGSQGGFRAFFISFPEKNIQYIALFNRPVDEFRQIVAGGVDAIKDANWFE